MTFPKKQEMVTFGQRHREHRNKLTSQLALGIIIKVMKRTEQRSPNNSDSAYSKYHFFNILSFSLLIFKVNKKVKSWSMYLFCFLGHNFIFPSNFSYKNFRHNKLFNKHPYIHLLASTINIFVYFLFYISIHSPLYPSIGPFFFLMHSIVSFSYQYTSPLMTSVCISLTKFHIKLFSFHRCRLFAFQWLSCKQHVAEFWITLI